LDPLFPTGTS